jgi:hypothetical protein
LAGKQYGIPLEAAQKWREALHGIAHTFGHTWENCYAMNLTTGLKTYLYCFEKENIRMVCPISEREFNGYVDIVKPFGFSGFVGNGECAEFSESWNGFVRDRGYICGYPGLNPIFDYSETFEPKEVCLYGNIFVLDLTTNIDDLLAKMSLGRRKQVKKLAGIQSKLVFDKSVLKDFFLKYYFNFLREKNASAAYFFSEDTFSFLFNLDNVIPVGLQGSGGVIAVVVFAYTGDVGEASFQVSLPEGRSYVPALIWYGAKYLKELRISSLNLGGGGPGIGEFKRRFGSKELPLRCLKQIYRPEIYKELCQKAGSNPEDMTGYFPAYRKGI